MENENYQLEGTGAAIFGGPGGGRSTAARPIGDDYQAPKGLPEWKQPSFDDDDRVDPDKYPEPKSGLAPNFLSRFFPDPLSQGLFTAKLFYFFFFSAFGSLFPLIGVYFKQLGMDAAQCGFLVGIRPIVEYLATPIWNKITDRLQKGKLMLILALVCWIVFTQPIGHIHPPVVACKEWNGTVYYVKLPNLDDRDKRSVDDLDLAWRVKRQTYSVGPHWMPNHVIGQSPQYIDFTVNYDHNRHREWVSPAWNNEVFERAGVHKVFFLILLLVVIGEFFSCPAIALADAAVIGFLGEEHQDKYSNQRMFGSIGWGMTMFIIGILLDHSKIFQDAKCDLSAGQRNYNVCFFVFSILMFCALLVATQLPFRYAGAPVKEPNVVPMNNLQNGPKKKQKEKDQKEKIAEMAAKTKVFAQQLRSMPEFTTVFRALANLRLLTCMLVAWVMGVGNGLIFTFLFWHLQDLGGTPTLVGIASVINHITEIAAYFYSFKMIAKFGHVKLLACGLLCNVLRFLYISLISWPWFVLPFEFVQGITHAAVWAACCSFIMHNTSQELRPSAQGFLHGMHHGFGKFCGAVFGGMLIKDYGTVLTFQMYSLACTVFLILFVAVNIFHKDEGTVSADQMDDLDSKNLMGDGKSHLAPHGVPSASSLPRALSSSKLEENEEAANATESYGASLNVPGANAAANNPFLEDVAYDASGSRVEDQGQYYGRGYSQARSGYSSSGFGY